ncbi:MAG: electron transfer flavoprotein subunit alpha/FixB family protein [Candidatus Freyarchaeota archaeon]
MGEEGECWVFAEHEGGEVRRASLELLAKGRELADELSEKLSAVILGWRVEGAARSLTRHGADKVYMVEHPLLGEYQVDLYCKAVSDLASERRPDAILFSSTFTGRDLAPRVAKRLGTGMTADCVELRVDRERRLIKQVKPSFGGNIMAEIVIRRKPQIATVKPGVAEVREEDRGGVIVRVHPDLSEGEVKTRRLKITPSGRTVDLEEAKVVVAGGRGAGREGFKLLGELASMLGGEVGGTRPAVDEGWLPRERQIGQSGRSVSPRLYLAFGVSGAIQHVVGFRRAGFVVAVNRDPEAPIFGEADVGVVADLHEFLPALIRELEDALKK